MQLPRHNEQPSSLLQAKNRKFSPLQEQITKGELIVT